MASPCASALSIASYLPTATRSLYQHKESATSFPDNDPDSDPDSDGNLFDKLQVGAKAAVAIGILFGIVFIVAFSMWYCCGCCGIRNQRRGMVPDGQRRIPSNDISAQPTGTVLPLHEIRSRSPQAMSPPPDPSPPSYDEVVSPRNRAPPGGMFLSRPVDEDGMIPDGKTPLSEIVFEDVVLDRPHTGGSSSQTFEQRHHGAGGNTQGHTNT
ncbi:hypothetical protein GLAREA_04588 [Glarea lozoyensis ATCC 20868]|uniref:Uncharacterized protein n=1 Tax=Glarea lozoyensis (strain ATCC 20868 / MF5171) TaxID=1116229 RepID=S3CMW8_GLAL2|nr:uncharacterized protein GLAREA_04588 [Glarea lozoyensis ATCC 20868]EPE27797.1 hypothetical protein GLAREA_04588 [Glarea lozoyensis ATCC 20868]